MSRVVSACLLVLLLCASARARADDRLATLDRELDYYAGQARRERLGMGTLGLVLGATLLPAGLVMSARDDDRVHAVGTVAIIAGAASLGAATSLFGASPLERLRDSHRQRKASGVPADELIRRTEAEWRERATRERRARLITGSIFLGLGVAMLPVGLVWILRAQPDEERARDQRAVGAAWVGAGAFVSAVGLASVVNDGPVEGTLKSHRVTFGVAPTLGGGALVASGRF